MDEIAVIDLADWQDEPVSDLPDLAQIEGGQA